MAQGVIVGGIIGAVGGAVAGKFLPRNSGYINQVFRFMVEPGKTGFTVKALYSGLSQAAGGGRRTLYGDGFRFLKGENLAEPNTSSFAFGALDNANTGLVTAPLTP